MDRDAAWKLVRQHVKNKNLRKHMLATEAVARRLARHFNADEEQWGLVGLLHDIDYDRQPMTRSAFWRRDPGSGRVGAGGGICGQGP